MNGVEQGDSEHAVQFRSGYKDVPITPPAGGIKFDGTRLWRIDLGRNIRSGAHYTQFQVYDYDGDGKAELAMKTADGTVDGTGTVIGSSSADHRNSSGYVLVGPEYLTMFNGRQRPVDHQERADPLVHGRERRSRPCCTTRSTARPWPGRTRPASSRPTPASSSATGWRRHRGRRCTHPDAKAVARTAGDRLNP
ncbi:hypothetical protein GCM10022403_097180 [Streptomyces coacervatus]|uniref:Rhamnogalacturonan lyase family 11 C-terminal domain-containing protein n=1 Tax=Streptomyces coacervatus TaxID=647381 RepID=A0ABP7JPY3_9ACTN